MQKGPPRTLTSFNGFSMNWFFIALSCAFLTACCDATSKRIMQEHDEWVTGTIILGLASLILLPVFLSLDLKPVSFELVALMAIVLPLEILGYYLFLSAIRMGALSLTVPLLAFTPVLTILTSALLLGESISWKGGFGIGLVTLGAYVLNADLMTLNLLAPIKALFSNPGSRRMFFVAVLWSVTSALGKKGVLIYDPIPFGFILLFGDLVIFALVCLFRFRTTWSPDQPSNEYAGSVPSWRSSNGRRRDYARYFAQHGPGGVHDFREEAQSGFRGDPGPAVVRGT